MDKSPPILTEEERRRRLLDQFAPETTWLSRIRGFFARRKREKLEREAAEKRRREHELAQQTPAFKCSIIGKTQFVNEDGSPHYTANTHLWTLYETGTGKRSFKFKRTHHRYGAEQFSSGEDHGVYAWAILPWLNYAADIDYDETMKNGEVRRRLKT